MSGTMRVVARSIRQQVFLNYRRLTRPSVVNHVGVKIAIDDHLSPAVVESLFKGDYEKSELKGICFHLQPDDVVMELGAGLGFISLQCARVIGANRVFAFEANPALEPHIRKNYELNGLQPTLEIGVLGDGQGEVDFFVEDDLWESSLTRRSPTARRVSVPLRPLNDAICRIKPTFLIMDIEGGESEIMRIIDFQTIRKVAVELHPAIIGNEKVDAVKRRLSEAGFVADHRYSVGQQLHAVKA